VSYLVFGGDAYYPSGGIDDLMGNFSDLEDAVAFALHECPVETAKRRIIDWIQVVEPLTGKVVYRWGSKHGDSSRDILPSSSAKEEG
jgi:hypothetical protein